MLPGGLGLPRPGCEAVMPPGGLPGEGRPADRLAPTRGVRWGQARKIIKASPLRIPSDCPWSEDCGGCDFLEVDPRQALELKAGAALGDLSANWGLKPALIQSPLAARYRYRAVLHLDRLPDGSFSAGFYDKRRRLIVFDSCLLLSAGLEALTGPIRLWAAGLGPEASGAEIEISQAVDGAGRQILFLPRPGGLTRRGVRSKPPGLAGPFLKKVEELPQILLSEGIIDTSVFVIDRGTFRRISPQGPDRLTVSHWPQWNLALKAAPGGFSQVNPPVNHLMVEKILELSAPLAPGRALDLYSGLGNIALPLAKNGFWVSAVEESPQSVKAARENARGLSGFEIIADSTEKAVRELAARGAGFDLVVLDPPRAGARDLAPAINRLAPLLIIYVACHPAVLSRDLPAFVSLGYSPRQLWAFDMFPRTSHLETVVALAG